MTSPAGSALNIPDAASLASYTLSMTAPSASEPTDSSPFTACPSNFTVPPVDPWYVMVRATGASSAVTGGGVKAGRTLEALVKVNDSVAPPLNAPPPPGPSYTADAASEGLGVDLAGTPAVAITNPPESAADNGSQPTQTSTSTSGVVVPGSNPDAAAFLSATLVSDTAVAESDGSSYACAGALSAGGSLGGGSTTTPCSSPGSSSYGLVLDLGRLPGVDLTNVADVQVDLNAATSWATDVLNTTTQVNNYQGAADLANGTVKVTLLGGLLTLSVPLDVPGNGTISTPNTNLLQLVTQSLTGNGISMPDRGAKSGRIPIRSRTDRARHLAKVTVLPANGSARDARRRRARHALGAPAQAATQPPDWTNCSFASPANKSVNEPSTFDIVNVWISSDPWRQ